MTRKFIIIYIYTIMATIVADCARTRRMIGGTKVLCGEQVRIATVCKSIDLKHLCGSVLLSPRAALTAAHCVMHHPIDYVLMLDNYCTDSIIPPIAAVLEIFTHYLYDKYSGAHDIALLSIELDLDVAYLFDDSILPKSSFGLTGTCSTYGYRLHEDMTSKDLMQANMTIVSLDQCLVALGSYVAPEHDSGMLCAVGDGADACQGDSGSPLMCEGFVEGVSSYGLACGVPGLPGVYTSVSAHSLWIQSIINDTTINL